MPVFGPAGEVVAALELTVPVPDPGPDSGLGSDLVALSIATRSLSRELAHALSPDRSDARVSGDPQPVADALVDVALDDIHEPRPRAAGGTTAPDVRHDPDPDPDLDRPPAAECRRCGPPVGHPQTSAAGW
jgi:hypothetical protein